MIELQPAHTYFSAQCYNACWKYIDRPETTADENQTMIALAYASYWHWTQRHDCEPRNLSVAYWQLSRVHALAGLVDQSLDFGKRCLTLSEAAKLDPFYIAYAHEAIGRAALGREDWPTAQKHLAVAAELAKAVDDPKESQQLKSDLELLDQSLDKR